MPRHLDIEKNEVEMFPLQEPLRGERIVLPVHRKYSFSHEETTKLDPITLHTKNALGFRGPDPPRDFAKRLTLVTIGGSTTECLFLSDGKTWTDVLARRLTRSWPDVWVNNAGLDGQSSYGHLILLRDLIVSLRPRVAVFLIGVNDIGREDLTTFDQSLSPAWSRWEKAGVFMEDHSEVVSLAHNLVRMARTSYRDISLYSPDRAACRVDLSDNTNGWGMPPAAPVPIAIMMTSFEPGGTERQMIELVRRLDPARWAVHVACFHTRGAWFGRVKEVAASVAEFPVKS